MRFDDDLAPLIQKFDLSGPRYTSYPTVPAWSDQFGSDSYRSALERYTKQPEPLSVYVHIPFCHSRCYYCGCNVVIKRHNPDAAEPYLAALSLEVDLVTTILNERPVVNQFHIGGGTPNYLTNDQSRRLFQRFHERFSFAKNAEVSVEVDPRYLSREMLKVLVRLGVNRISMGVQDFDPQVQKAVNRVQSYESVENVMTWSRELGISSVNVDLIYGLPYQTADTIRQTIDQIIALRPDRIAFYSYAHIPNQISHQSLLNKLPMATGPDKLNLFLEGRSQLISAGYQAIAMDHFALPSDELAKAFLDRKLYRNFMGYTTQPAFQYMGFGVSAIGNIGGAFAQNEKDLNRYIAMLGNNQFPIARGMVLTPDDEMRQWVINQIMCHFEVDKAVFQQRFNANFDSYFQSELQGLSPFTAEGLVQDSPDRLVVLETGKWFVRNVAMVFDAYLKQMANPFSRTV